jgi:UDP-glucose 4-epimerase
MSKRFLVTGGAGFIGSHLVDSFLADGHRVTVLDNLSTGSLSNLERAMTDPGFLFIQGSVVDPYVVDDAVSNVDMVVHLAAAVGVETIMQKPLGSFHTNVRGSEIVLEAVHRYGRRVFIASTSEIYGKNTTVPLTEDSDRIIGPPSVTRWSYSTSKAVDEILANLYHAERGVDSVIARMFNTVGPRQSPAYGMVLPRLVRQALAGEPLTVYGTGHQARCFLHVSDAVRAIRLLLDSDETSGRTFNIGSGEEITILKLAQRVLQVTGSDSEIALFSYDDAFGADSGFEDMMRRVPDTTRLRNLTGWTPTLDLWQILQDTVSTARQRTADHSVSAGSGAVH